MRFNSTVSEEPYQGLKCVRKAARNGGPLTRIARPGGARLSSARILRRSLNWGNERNPYRLLQVSDETALFIGEEGGDDVKSACPFDALGNTRVTMAETTGS